MTPPGSFFARRYAHRHRTPPKNRWRDCISVANAKDRWFKRMSGRNATTSLLEMFAYCEDNVTLSKP